MRTIRRSLSIWRWEKGGEKAGKRRGKGGKREGKRREKGGGKAGKMVGKWRGNTCIQSVSEQVALAPVPGFGSFLWPMTCPITP